MSDLTVYIGWDSKEPAAAAVLAHSILTRASQPVWIMPLTRTAVGHLYTRERGPLESTEFSMTRFLVPALHGRRGWALFLDCDMLCRVDIHQIVEEARQQPGKAVYVCQHDYEATEGTKFLGNVQTRYPRKNWSSVMLFDTTHPAFTVRRVLTPDVVNKASGLFLHRFQWLEDQDIGSLDLRWNWLVGEYPHNDEAAILHYTLGTPCLPGYEACDHAEAWWAERAAMLG